MNIIQTKLQTFLSHVRSKDIGSITQAINSGLLDLLASNHTQINWLEFFTVVTDYIDDANLIHRIALHTLWGENAKNTKVLAWAIQHNHLLIAQECIRNGADVNSISDSHSSYKKVNMLHLALVHVRADKKIILALINAGADVTKPCCFGVLEMHPLHIALMRRNNDDIEIFKAIISAGAKLDTTRNGSTLLEDAAAIGNFQILELFIKSGANINYRGDKGASILLHATNKHYKQLLNMDPRIVYKSLELGAPIVKQNAIHVLGWACTVGDIKLIHHILNLGFEFNLHNNPCKSGGHSVLHIAVDNGHIEIVKLLLKLGLGPDISGGHNTPLSQAILNKDVAMVKLLIDAGASVNTKSAPEHKSLLELVVELQNDEMLDLLLQHGPNLDIISKSGTSALFKALEHKNNSMTVKLIDAGCKVNIISNTGQTPIHIAISDHNVQLIKKLISVKADLTQGNFKGISALELAYKTNQADLVVNTIFEIQPAKVGAQLTNELKAWNEYYSCILDYTVHKRLCEIAMKLITKLHQTTDVSEGFDKEMIMHAIDVIQEYNSVENNSEYEALFHEMTDALNLELNIDSDLDI